MYFIKDNKLKFTYCNSLWYFVNIIYKRPLKMYFLPGAETETESIWWSLLSANSSDVCSAQQFGTFCWTQEEQTESSQRKNEVKKALDVALWSTKVNCEGHETRADTPPPPFAPIGLDNRKLDGTRVLAAFVCSARFQTTHPRPRRWRRRWRWRLGRPQEAGTHSLHPVSAVSALSPGTSPWDIVTGRQRLHPHRS